MNFELTASMMCANYGHLAREVKDLEEGGIDSFHIDIMDGRYVPNFAMSLNDMTYIASATKKPLDVHLMIEHPNNNIHLFLNRLRPGDTVYIHPEAEYHPSTTLQKIINAGMIPGIAAGVFLRFICAFLTGVFFWGEGAGSQNVFIYSAVYNGAYLIPETIICIVIAMIPQIRKLARQLSYYQ